MNLLIHHRNLNNHIVGFDKNNNFRCCYQVLIPCRLQAE